MRNWLRTIPGAGLCLLVACGTSDPVEPAAEPSRTATPIVVPASVVEPSPVRLGAWRGPVEALFVHPLILRPRLAFAPGGDRQGFLDYFVTAREFRVLLEELWRNGWTLVDVHKAAAGTVRVPERRKPLVIYEDDANYYRYFRGRGLARRLVLDSAGQVRAQLADGTLSTADVVPMVDAFVEAHPDFSAEGAKGVLALTGFEGLFGERQPIARAAQGRFALLAEQLRADGWTFASHTYGHIDLSTSSLASVREDTGKWRDLTRALGLVDVLVYPYGARPDPVVLRELVRLGFPIQVDIDIRPRRRHVGGATVMSRRHVDGIAFDVPRRQRQFYDVAAVRDPRRPAG
jgi:hypothetical protein